MAAKNTLEQTPQRHKPRTGHEPHDDLGVASRALSNEIKGLEALQHTLGTSFVRALDLIAACDGRVIVSGIGKSGHVARKIAATLASTGTPAFFIHPTEASHGDLGMVSDHDCLLVLSNSGETAELADIISYAKRNGIALIAVTQKATSSLASAATVTLLLPPAIEACPIGMAPTTSTTMMLALGDTLAVTLLSRRGFTSEQFRSLHPGGTLGRKLLTVADLMHGRDQLPCIALGSSMADAVVEMTKKSFGCVAVIDAHDALAGVITDGDLRRHMSPDLLSHSVDDVMTRMPRTIPGNALAVEALHIMNERKVTSLFVVDTSDLDASQPHVCGIIHVHDCLRAGLA